MDIELGSLINQHKNKILNAAILILALNIAGNIYKGQAKNTALIREGKGEQVKINKVLEEINRSEINADAFKKMINKKDTSSIVSTFRNMANESGVKIDAFKPQAEQVYPAYVRYSFTLSIVPKNYHGLSKFIAKLENSGDIYWVDSLEMSSSLSSEEDAGYRLTANLKISTILIKD